MTSASGLLMSDAGLDQLKADEGLRLSAYNDATGRLIERTDLAIPGYPSIGYGLNLIAGITADEAEWLLINRLHAIEHKLETVWIDFPSWPQIHLDVAVMIDYNTGSVQKWPGLVNAIRSHLPESLIVRNIYSSEAYRSSATHSRYQRFCDAILRDTWKGAD